MKYIIPIIILSFLLLGCKKDDDSSTTTTELEGTWKTPCFPKNNTFYIIKSVAVTGSSFVEKIELHSDSSCTSDNRTQEVTFGSLSIGDDLTYPTYGTTGGSGAKFTMTLNANTWTLQNSQEVSSANTDSYCGDTDWELNVAKSVAGKTCVFMGTTNYWSSGTAIYGVYLLDGSKLFWKYSNSSYPDAVDTGDNDTFTKQ